MVKRALIISNSAGLITSFLKNDVEILIEKGYKVVCACNTYYKDWNTDDFFKKYDINVIHVDFPIRNLDLKKLARSYYCIQNILKKDEYGIIHCHSTIAAAIGRSCSKNYRKNRIKVCYTSHGLPFYKGNNGLKAQLFERIENHYSTYTDLIFSVCNEDYLNLKKMNCKNVYLMHGVGIDVRRFEDCAIDVEKYRDSLGIDKNEIMILSVGELNTNKNHQIVIKALAKLNMSGIVYTICGRELTEAGKRKELIELAEKLKVNLKMLGFRKDIPEICKCADIGVLPSFKEGLGLSGVEMLASGLPVVGSNRQGIKDYIVDDLTGYLADPNSVESFSEAISKCLVLKNRNNITESCINMSRIFSTENARQAIYEGYKSIGI